MFLRTSVILLAVVPCWMLVVVASEQVAGVGPARRKRNSCRRRFCCGVRNEDVVPGCILKVDGFGLTGDFRADISFGPNGGFVVLVVGF